MIRRWDNCKEIGTIEDIREGKIKDLSGANLRDANLRNAELRDADLKYADLRWADLRYADLKYADLSNADLSNANLRYADLSKAELSNADLRDADLRSSDLSEASYLYNNNLACMKTDYKVYQQTLIGSEGRTITFIPEKNTMWIGCRKGTKEECIQAIKDKYPLGHKLNKEYKMIIIQLDLTMLLIRILMQRFM